MLAAVANNLSVIAESRGCRSRGPTKLEQMLQARITGGAGLGVTDRTARGDDWVDSAELVRDREIFGDWLRAEQRTSGLTLESVHHSRRPGRPGRWERGRVWW